MDMKEQSYIYIFVRTDITLADQICQVAHACLESGKRFRPPNNHHLVLLAVKTQEELQRVSELCNAKNIEFCETWEPDDDLGFTAVATAPIVGKQRNAFSSYGLWRQPN